jgi:hypothetical protein
MKKIVSTSDLYEGAYYLLHGCELAEIEGAMVNGKIICTLTFAGENITRRQLTYLNGDASANILDLRRTVGQVSAWVHNAKRSFKNQLANNTPASQGGRA